MIEIIVTFLIILLALVILFKKFNNIKKGKCDCSGGNCNSCPKTALKLDKKDK